MHTFLQQEKLQEALIHPYFNPLVAPAPLGFRGGLIIKNAGYKRLRQTRYRKPIDTFEFSLPSQHPKFLMGKYNYAGPIYHHFGHVLSEFVHRILPNPNRINHADIPWIFVTTSNSPNLKISKYPRHIQEIYEFLDISDSNSIIINSPTVIEELEVVESGSDFGGGPYLKYLDILNNFSNSKLNRKFHDVCRPKLIYVSRSGFVKKGGFLGESYIDELFVKAGFSIFRPELFPFDVQMDVYQKSKVLVFSEGSACHGVELLGKCLETCIFLSHRKSHREIFSNILRPRSNKYAVFDKTRFLGAPLLSSSGTAAYSRGVSVFRIQEMIDFFELLDIKLSGYVNIEKYFEIAKNDLYQFCRQESLNSRYSEAEFNRILFEFTEEEKKQKT